MVSDALCKSHTSCRPQNKTRLITKCRAIFLLCAALQVGTFGYTQTVNITVKNATIKKVFTVIERQTGYTFIYTEDLLKKAVPVTVDLKNVTVEQAIVLCFKGQPLTYSIIEKVVVVKPVQTPVIQSDKTSALVNMPSIINITGQVINENGEPVEGVSVVVKGTNTGTATNANGVFSLFGVDENASLVFSATNIEGFEVKMNGKSELNVTAKIKVSKLDEIQVIAYGTITQRYNVGSVATVTAKEIENQPVSNLFQTLQGRVPGLVVTNTSGAPGAITLTQIRGQNSLANKAQGTVLNNYNQPLYIIDGVPLPVQNTPLAGSSILANSLTSPYSYLTGLSPINGINPADIESISVLKDADATSIYGSQGSNGVILITTKRGKPGVGRIDASVNSGPTTASRTTQMMNTQQYLQMRREALANSGVTANLGVDPDLLLFDQNKYTDWKKVFFGGTGLRTDAHLSASGGSVTNSYFISGGYTRETYNYPGDLSENRFSLHSSFTHRSVNNHLSFDFGTDYSYEKNKTVNGNRNIFVGFQLAPNFPDLLDANKQLLWSYNAFDYNSSQGNPLAYTIQPANSAVYTLNTHLAFKYQLFKSVNIGVNAGYGRLTQGYYSSIPVISQNPANRPTGSATFTNQNNGVITIEPQLNFTQKISSGVLSVLLGGTYRHNKLDGTQTLVGNYFTDALLNSISGGTVQSASNSASDYKYAGVLARVNYIWKNKYIINLTSNHNGSSNFGPDEQFGNFGSVGTGWILTGENFIKKAMPFMSFAKLSFDYGTSGSDGVAPYQYQANWRVLSSTTGYQGFRGLNPANLLNPVYKWSLNQKFNEQLDMAFFRDRLYMNLTFYQNKASDQLVSYIEPIQIGFGSITANAPYVVQNKRVEFSLTSKNIQSKNFQWSTSFNISHNTNKLLSFPKIEASPYAAYYIVGQPVFAQILVPYIGVDPQTGIFQYTTKVAGTVNATSAYNNVGGDATEIVDVTPKFTGGLTNSLTYKGFSLSLFFQFAVQKGPNYLYSVYNLGITGPGRPLVNEPVALLNNWKKPGDIASIQRFSAGNYTTVDQNANKALQLFSGSTGAYSDASYIRLKNVAISYRFSAPRALKSSIKGFSFYVNAQNLFLITGYKVGDPETQNLYTIPPQRTFVAGVNIYF